MKSIGTGKTTVVEHSFRVDIHANALYPPRWLLVIEDAPPQSQYTAVWPMMFEGKCLRIHMRTNPIFKSRIESESINRYVAEVSMERLAAWFVTQSNQATTLVVIKVQSYEYKWHKGEDGEWGEVHDNT